MTDLAADLHTWIAFLVFSVIGAFTPGPNTLVALATGIHFGWPRVWPHAAGAMLGAGIILSSAAAGALATVMALPGALPILKTFGIVYLVWLAWSIGRSRAVGDRTLLRPLALWQSVLLQFVNVKGLLLALAIASTWFTAALKGPLLVGGAVAVYLSCCGGAILLWARAGAGLRAWLATGQRLAWFNRAMAAAILASALTMV